MDSKDHQVTLTSREQQLLADLERATKESDPHLDAWLRTARRRSWLQAFSRSWTRWSPTRQLVVAVVTLLAATVLMLVTFTRSLVVAGLAAGLQATALGLGIRAVTQLRRSRSS